MQRNIRIKKLNRFWWLAPKPFDLVWSSLYLGVLLAHFYNLVNGCDCLSHAQLTPIILVAIAVLLAIDRVEYRMYGEESPVRVAVVLLCLRTVLIEVVAQLDDFHFSPFLYLIIPFLAFQYFGNSIGYWLALAAWLTYLFKISLYNPLWYHFSNSFFNFLLFSTGLVFVMTMARVVLKEKASRVRAEALLSDLEASHQQLKAYAEQVAELATTKERNRLARDIHDSLGHSLTVINIQLEKALAFRQRNPQEAVQAVRDAKELASAALQEVRHSVGTLRTTDETFSFSSAIDALVEAMRNDQFVVEVSMTGSTDGYSRETLMVLYRATQEGLTNIQKHAAARIVQLSIDFQETEAHLSLSDDGRGFEPSLLRDLQPGREGHYGLQGLQERLEMVHGSLHVESMLGQGTRLLVSVSKKQSTIEVQ